MLWVGPAVSCRAAVRGLPLLVAPTPRKSLRYDDPLVRSARVESWQLTF